MTEQLLRGTPTQKLLTIARIVLGPAAAIATFLFLPAAAYDDAGTLVSGLSPEGRATAAVGVLMSIFWLLEAIPLSITALMPVTLLPLLGAVSVADAAAPYARDILFLFFGGFMLGLALERSGLHRRIALRTLRVVGTSPTRIIAGFMIASAFLSGWVSNTATAILMMPIAISVITLISEHAESNRKDGDPPPLGANFATALLLGIAYAASIGGIATLIGTPPNLVFAAVAEETLGIEISMARWIMVAGPMVLIFLPIAWLTLTRFIFPIRVKTIPGARELVDDQIRSLGPIRREEALVLCLFCLTAAAWVFRPQLVDLGRANDWPALANLRDSSIAMLSAVAMFMIPSDIKRRRFLMDWETVATRMPWGIFLLFGGGLSLAAAITSTGLAEFIAGGMQSLAGMPTWLLIVVLAISVNFLTEVTSNTALTTALLPILAASAPVLGIEPLMLLVPATIAASLAFMLPVATPPNAVVFSTGKVRVNDMIKAGITLNLIGSAFAAIVGLFFTQFITG